MYLIGAGGHAKVIIDVLETSNIPVNGVFDSKKSSGYISGYPIIPQHKLTKEMVLLIAIGDNASRKKVAVGLPNNSFGTGIHPRAIIAKSATIDEGSVVIGGAIINSATVVQKHVIINTGASVDHDCHVSDFVHVAPGATLTGGILLGEGAFIGAGASVCPNLTIGKWAVVGAGAVVTESVPDYATVVGNPARVIKLRES